MKPRYRMVRVDYASGYTQWNIEKKFLWWWEYLDGYFDKEKAEKVLARLNAGVPYRQKTLL